MTTYSDLTDTIEYDEAELVPGCCCGAPEPAVVVEPFSGGWDSPADDVLVGYGDDTWAADQLVVPDVDQPSIPVDASAVIPAGQPGGFQASPAVIVDDLGWQASGSDVDDLYPSVASIGGNPFGVMTITPADAGGTALGHEAIGTVGGGEPLGMTITRGDTAAPPVGPFSATIGPAHDSPAAALGSLIGMPVDRGGAVLGSILLSGTIHGNLAPSAIWASSQ